MGSLQFNNYEIKGILLDLDDTLYDYVPSHDFAMEMCQKQILNDFNISKTEFEKHFSKAKEIVKGNLAHQAIGHSRLHYFKTFFELTKLPISKALDYQDLYWDSFMSQMKLSSGVDEFFNYCLNQEVPVIILTDLTLDIQLKKIKRLGIENKIYRMLTSEEAGIEKPAEKIFSMALDKFEIKLGPENVLMIGDNLQKDIVGARNLSIHTAWKVEDSSMDKSTQEEGFIFSRFEQLLQAFQIEEK